MSLWQAYVLPDGACALCAGSGFVDTRGGIASRAGVECGVRAPCFCPASTHASERSDEDRWLDFESKPHQLCGLCGNYGIIDTRGIRAFCICPNGQAMREGKADIDRWPSRIWFSRGLRERRVRT